MDARSPEAHARIQRIREHVNASRDDMLDLLRQAVNIESPTEYGAGVNELGDLLAGQLARLGLRVQRVPETDYGNHVLAEIDVPDSPRILFFGHIDTVYSRGTGRPFAIDGARAYGAGVIDMKSGLLALIFALRALQATGGIPISIRTFYNSDEEPGSPRSIPRIPELIRGVDYGCVLEPAEPDGAVLTSRKGIGRFALTVTGRAAHAGQEPETGINANRELAFQVIAAEDLADPARGTTINAGRIEGGTLAYVISERATASIDARVWDPEEQLRIEQGMVRLEQANRVLGTRITVVGSFHRPPMIKLPGTERLMRAVSSAAELLGLPIHFGDSGAASDGNSLVAAGLPTLDGMGPVGGRAHSPDEYMELDSFFERTALLAGFLVMMGTQEG